MDISIGGVKFVLLNKAFITQKRIENK